MILFKYGLAALIPDVPEFIEEMNQRKDGKLDIINEEFKLKKVNEMLN